MTTSVRAHPGLPPGDLVSYLAERSIFISGGLGELAGKIFRIGHMGRSIELTEVELLLGEIGNALRDAGVAVPEGANLQNI